MANTEHLEVIKKGAEAWNAWRLLNPEIVPDLRQANLMAGIQTALRNPKSVFSVFYQQNFKGINLRQADLRGANLSEVDLSQSDLSGAGLSYANLRGAKLIGANLADADLRIANLGWCDLSGATIFRAKLKETTFGNTKLFNVSGLDQCEFTGHSYLDHLTLLRSGRLPEGFLRGVGLPEVLVKSAMSFIYGPKYFSCFISYSHKDENFAEYLFKQLQDYGIRCWYAPENLKIGQQIEEGIAYSVGEHDKLIIVLSRHSMASAWVEKEYSFALAKEREQGRPVLLPICLDDAIFSIKSRWALELSKLRIADFRNWDKSNNSQSDLKQLIHALQKPEE